MPKFKISPIYSSANKMGGKRPLIGRPSDESKGSRSTDVVDRADVFTKDGILRAQRIHKNQWGCFIIIGGHEIKVEPVGVAWKQKGVPMSGLKMEYHPRELPSIEETPIQIRSDYARLAKPTHYKNQYGDLVKIVPTKSRNLKGEVRDLTPRPQLKEIKEMTGGLDWEERERLIAELQKAAGWTTRDEAWFKKLTLGK